MPKSLQITRVLGFDFGMKRIGVAVGQTISCTAEAVGIIDATDGIPKQGALQEVIDAWQPDAFIVGLPLDADGKVQWITHAARKFANRLQQLKRPVYLVDERYTSKQARDLTQDAALDAFAAQLITEQWLNDYKKNSG